MTIFRMVLQILPPSTLFPNRSCSSFSLAVRSVCRIMTSGFIPAFMRVKRWFSMRQKHRGNPSTRASFFTFQCFPRFSCCFFQPFFFPCHDFLCFLFPSQKSSHVFHKPPGSAYADRIISQITGSSISVRHGLSEILHHIEVIHGKAYGHKEGCPGDFPEIFDSHAIRWKEDFRKSE